MKQPVYAFAAGVLFFFSAAGACTDPTPAGPIPDRTPSQLVGEKPFPNPRSGNQRLANSVVGFGGAYFEGGTFHVYLTDLSVASSVSGAIRSELITDRRGDARVEFVKGGYTFVYLASLGKLLGDAMDDGVVQDGVDSRNNKFLIIVTSEAAAGRMRSAIARRKLPLSAFRIEIGEGARNTGNKNISTDYVNPLVGGVRIESNSSFGEGGSAGGMFTLVRVLNQLNSPLREDRSQRIGDRLAL